MSNAEKWAPRAEREARLRYLEQQLGRFASIEIEIERAVTLDALGRRVEAQKAFIEILLKAPTHFTALNEFGNCLAGMGSITAALRVYSEAVTHHPTNPTGHINLANLLLHGGDLTGARKHYEIALRLNPGHPQAHQGLGAILTQLGDHASAKSHFKIAFGNRFISSLPYRGTKRPIALLLLVSSAGGNIPTASFLDDRLFMTSVVVADFLDPSVPLPAHQLIFNAIGDADLCAPALEAAARLIKRTSAPVINDPAAVIKTGRMSNAQRFHTLPSVVTPRTIELPRAVLIDLDAATAIYDHGFVFPLLLRSPGFHTGHNFVLVESAADLASTAASLPGENLLVIEYLAARGPDGNARKYRVMTIGGRIYPLHLAVSQRWKVHYFTADMANQEHHRLEEAAFLNNMPAVLGSKAVAALERIADALGLDYGGIDFGLSATGDVLLFEANATMVVNPPDANEDWNYRRPAVSKILDAIRTMIVRKTESSAQCLSDVSDNIMKIRA